MADFNVPNEFVPQSGQSISSQQMDQNFDAVELEIDRINDALGTGSGTVTDVRKVLYPQRPSYTGSQTPASSEFVDRKYLDATRGCRVGDAILSFNPNALPNDYGVVWAKMEGQQLAIATYPDFNTICQANGGVDPGRYDPNAGASIGNFVAPDWRGLPPYQLLGAGSALTAKVPNFVAANWLGSVIGESAHKQLNNEVGSHLHAHGFSTSAAPGSGRAAVSEATNINTALNQPDASVEAMNIVQKGFMTLVWVRIK